METPLVALNSDIIRVDPHITHYTIYITDNYTGNSIFTVNVTETQFTLNALDNDLCPMYHVSAWVYTYHIVSTCSTLISERIYLCKLAIFVISSSSQGVSRSAAQVLQIHLNVSS